MPTYQYSCTDCGHFFEILQSFSDDSLTVCPECEGRLRKVFNAVGVVFKGSGFYRNDSRPEGRRRDASSEAGRATGSSGSEGGSGNGSERLEERSARAASPPTSPRPAAPPAPRRPPPPEPLPL